MNITIFCIVVDFGIKKINLEKNRGLKMVVFQMKDEHPTNWANAYDTYLDISISRLVRNG